MNNFESNVCLLCFSQWLYSEVSIPSCISRPEAVSYLWTTNNPKIKFNFRDITSIDHQIDYSKRFDEKTKFEINVFMGNETSLSSTASLTLYPMPSKGIIDESKHISMISIGQKTGKFKISANLLDPDKSKSIGYLWNCHYWDSLEPCAINSDAKQLLITKDIQNRRELVLNSELMRSNKHMFGLHLIDSNDMTSKLFNPYTTVKVVEGNAPIVFIESVYVRVDDKKFDLIFNSNENIISIPSKTRLVIKGVIKKLIQFDSIEWHLSESLIQLEWSNTITKNGIISRLHLYPGQFYVNFNRFLFTIIIFV